MNLSGRGYPEDATNFNVPSNPNQGAQNAQVPSDIVLFAEFMRLLAPPVPSMNTPGGASRSRTDLRFVQSDRLRDLPYPGDSIHAAFQHYCFAGQRPVRAFSDFEIHHMGAALADNVSQGGAGGDQFRTAPLWGLGQRIFFLHDGRTTNLLTAIADHRSNGSEATQVAENFASLSPASNRKF